MNILIVGSGLTGCTFARHLKDDGNNVQIVEKLSHIGGLCYTKISPNNFLYEPYGSRVFHTKNEKIKNFITKFAKFNNYNHKKGIIIKNKLYHFPISYQEINKMPERNKIHKELLAKPKDPNRSNLETYMISQFGETLYRLFIYNYSKKMWNKEPKELEAELAENRVELKSENVLTFNGEWQGLPVGGYTKLLKKMTRGINIKYNSTFLSPDNFDIVIYSGRIDELLNYKYGRLPYRSMFFNYKANDNWECDEYGTINLPDHHTYIRKANFKVLYEIDSKDNWIQFQEPTDAFNNNLSMYPIYTKKNNKLFYKYLFEICCNNNIIPAGRLGLYKYLNMDQAIHLSMKMLNFVYDWQKLDPIKRFKNIRMLIK